MLICTDYELIEIEPIKKESPVENEDVESTEYEPAKMAVSIYNKSQLSNDDMIMTILKDHKVSLRECMNEYLSDIKRTDPHSVLYGVFDTFQVTEIFAGILDGVDNISIYANPKFDSDEMEQIRIGLTEGIDLSPYVEQDPDDDIIPHISRACILEEILEGFRNGVDISKYALPGINHMNLEQIRLGLEHGVDADIYAKPVYNDAQMKQIRIGLEHGVDVSKYNDPCKSESEMKKIREALELLKSTNDSDMNESKQYLD